ncbi:MAG: fluoride efflux transporter CrcB [Planctomycetes bacterium]|nr:fluoride efflux transporter CrcB [Planctomycetota bacterium]
MEWLVEVAVHPITLIAVGSAVGGNMRYWLGRWIDAQQWPGGIPWGTFVINVTGSLVLGFCAVWFLERAEPARRGLYLLLGTGFCGGYTTFSTFEWETFKLVRDENWFAAVANVFGSVAVGFLGVFLGALAAHLIFGRR